MPNPAEIFEQSKVLFPSSDIPITPGGYTLPKGSHSFPFAISFPLLSACDRSQSLVRHLETALPPSFDSHAPGHRGSVKIDYVLKAKVKRPGIFHWDISTQQELLFIPLDPPLSSIPSGLGHGTTTSRELYLHDIVPTRQLTACAQHSACQDPILLLEARLPSPAVLYAGDKIPISLLLHKFPAKPDNTFPIQLRSVAISLQSTTTVTVGINHTSWTSSRNLLQLTDLRRAVANSQEKDVLSELNSSMLHNVTIPKITPSFTTCTVRHEHSLEVTGGFSLETHAKSSLVKLVINVEIHSGVERDLDRVLPGPRGECEEGALDLIPVRPGCLRHLGPTGDNNAAIAGDFALLAGEVPPVLRILGENGIQVNALHNHMLIDSLGLFYVHFWAVDNSAKLGRVLRDALDQTNCTKASA
ncbi:uncharacterized protein B0I36DRAFT_353430 [Microdochium trichocladiopsis]|uniref:Uncharacterized protein n=1 Tax=Microdochium trichocladiopsis TaxID=1682393 RepID=A0A9P8XYR4_9PEZI|nr:uncharacterized protein B0I36DRAFT_353430 [Microdochium trichocladiopsis]KAH7025293.1 hypothetical protein B0I36DRAFT_353430 [Microdochium trichocladiopsis]